MTEASKFEAPIQREKANNPNWSDEENEQWDTWVEGGVKTGGQATADIVEARLKRGQSSGIEPPEPAAEPAQPAPPQPDETDEQIRQRHREDMRNRLV